MKLGSYVCDNQLDIFDFLHATKEEALCNDERINSISKSITEIFEKIKDYLPPVKNVSKEYSIWDHVPNLGYRLSISYAFECKFLNIPELFCGVGQQRLYELFECERLIEEAEKDNIELSITATPNMLFFFTLDIKKRKVKQEYEED